MKKVLYILCSVSLIQFGNFLSAQTPELDSLKLALKKAKHDTAKCTILSNMIDAEADENIWSQYNEQIKIISEKNVAIGGTLKKVYQKYLGAAYINAGTVAQMKGNWPVALEQFQKGVKICEEIDDKEGIGAGVISLADIYRNQGDLPKALDYYGKSLRVNEEIGNKLGTAHALYMLGYVYKMQGDLQKTAEYNEKSLKLYQEIGFKSGIANCYNQIAVRYDDQNNVPKAMDYYLRSLKIHQEEGSKHNEASSLLNIGKLYNKQGLMEKALEYFKGGLDLYTETEDKPGITMALSLYAQALTKMNKIQEAFTYADKSIKIAKEIGYPESIKNAARTLKTILIKQNKHKEAIEMFTLELKMRDSINGETARKLSIKKQFQIEYERATIKDSVAHVAKMKVEQLKHEEAITQQRTYTYGGIIGFGFMLVVAGVSFNAYRNKRKTNIIITEQKQIAEVQKQIIEEKQKHIIDSINYAKRIQTTHLPSESYVMKKMLELRK